MASGPLPVAVDATHLSPHHRPRSNSASPHVNPYVQTPDDSVSTMSHYPSDFSDDDPFHGIDFNSKGGTPSFLEESIPGVRRVNSQPHESSGSFVNPPQCYPLHTPSIGVKGMIPADLTYPLTPDQTISPQLRRRGTDRTDLSSTPSLPTSVSPNELQPPFSVIRTSQDGQQLTPNGSCPSSDDGLPSTAQRLAQSPLVTVSDWGMGTVPSLQPIERDLETNSRGRGPSIRSTPGDLMLGTGNESFAPSNNGTHAWEGSGGSGRQGLNPEQRPGTTVESVNDLASRRKDEERKQVVDSWLNHSIEEGPEPAPFTAPIVDHPGAGNNIEDDGIPLGDKTENTRKPGQTYFNPKGGEFTPEDIEIIRSNQNWADAPRIHGITKAGSRCYQPPTSQAAIARYDRMCRDNDSVVSVTATLGTRRRSLPSIADLEVDSLSGNILRRLTISRTEPRKPGSHGHGFFNNLRTLARKRSSTLKRSHSSHDEEGFKEAANEKQDNTIRLAPPTRTSSWGKKQTPSINTALVSMGQSVAAVGAGQAHSRSGSVSATSPSPAKPSLGGLTVKTTFRRPRSKSDLPKPGGKTAAGSGQSHSSLADLWKRTGGPPVAALGTAPMTAPVPPPSVHGVDLEEEEDDDDLEDGDLKTHHSSAIDSVPPTFEGFKSYINRLNPTVPPYLADRIAYQQLVRYKALLNLKLKHAQQGRNCPCGALCIAQGGSARNLDQKGDTRGPESLISPESNLTPIEGVISQESFPQDIPLPPTTSLPAEFECQLCFQAKKFQKPSDWTKHVHEDVQPFTCTWERCKDPKIFKRKADWVRHENEGHRHLEWWKCDVDDCTHVCYRRDNFLQHLVREHKLDEPKVKTKAARAATNDPVWQRVERCHNETTAKAQDEPCRFCGRAFPTWKKLTVHLAKHMEQISLPILRLVAVKQVTADTVISPVQDPPRPYPPLPMKNEGDAAVTYPMRGFGKGHSPVQKTGMDEPGMNTSFQNNQASLYDFGSATNSFQDPSLVQLGGQMSVGMGTTDTSGAGYVPTSAGSTGYDTTNPASTEYDNQVYLQANNVPVPGIQRVHSMPVRSNSYVSDENGYLTPTVPSSVDVVAFPAAMHPAQQYVGLDGLGLADENGFTPQGSLSPYGGSPNQGSGYYQM
ncbi:hypothetical protein VUR80DRAFT_4393 [Thermomyces stellatus]